MKKFQKKIKLILKIHNKVKMKKKLFMRKNLKKKVCKNKKDFKCGKILILKQIKVKVIIMNRKKNKKFKKIKKILLKKI